MKPEWQCMQKGSLHPLGCAHLLGHPSKSHQLHLSWVLEVISLYRLKEISRRQLLRSHRLGWTYAGQQAVAELIAEK